MDFSKKYVNCSPEQDANIISRLCFFWLIPLFRYGYKNTLGIKNLYNATKDDLSETLGNTLEEHWKQEILRASAAKKPPELRRAIIKSFIKPYSFFGIIIFFQSVVLKMVYPLVLAELINHFDPSRSMPVYQGWLLAAGVVLLSFINMTIFHYIIVAQRRIGMRCRVAVCSLIYRKLLRLNKTSVANTNSGRVINLLSNDVARFDMVSEFLHYLWIMPIQTVAVACLMYNSIGYAAFPGITAILLQAVPLQGFLSHLQGKLRLRIANCTDHRVQLMNEITNGIKVIKMYAWEQPFDNLVRVARKLEIKVINKTSCLRGIFIVLTLFTERYVLYLTVITYALLGHKPTADKVFAAAQYFNTMQVYICVFYPLAISFYAEAKSSIKRIEEFLLQEEQNTTHGVSENINISSAVNIMSANANWISNSTNCLSNINLNIKPGTLSAVVGPVGSGKSSLLQLMLKELPLSSGKLEINGNISYASQEPWLFTSTVRNNILFGLPYVEDKYRTITKACALDQDFESLPYGDHTFVGERGVALSGGQRARINLARAVYREADIYLLDDPLSAVDASVGKHLFEECILRYLGRKTVILVTHQLQFLSGADQVIIINEGEIEDVSTYNALSNKSCNLYCEASALSKEIKENSVERELENESITIKSNSDARTEEDNNDEPNESQEFIEKDVVSFFLYTAYFREGGSVAVFVFVVILLILSQVASNASDMWVTHWVNSEADRTLVQNHTTGPILDNITEALNTIDIDTVKKPLYNTMNNYSFSNDTIYKKFSDSWDSTLSYIYIYTGLILTALVLTIWRSILFIRICMNASRGLHNNMFSSVLKATMRFFDTNPSGRILNRFSKDMGAVDEILPKALLDSIQVFLLLCGVLVLVCIVTPWMIIPTFILITLFLWLRKIYLATGQNVKRLEAITQAVAFSHVTASLNGLTTIRALDAQKLIIKEFDQLLDQHTSAWYLLLATSSAFGFYLDVVNVVFLATVTFQFLIFDDGTTLGGYVGLLISQTLLLSGKLQFGIRQTTEVANQMTNVERIIQYTRLDKEGPFESVDKPHSTWPTAGKIEFKNLTLRYVLDELPILNNVNITIEAGEKVGIVGRTGAGKSSLIAALFRLAPTEGYIFIDAIDTKKIGLHDLRSNISIIPQEPVLFSGTIRYNLDPINNSDESVLWKALEDVELKNDILDLSQDVSVGGSNFSVGQRQLVCLARAIIRKKNILIMDEATANVDPRTDFVIQKTIREKFKDCTVLTIAHRLNTVMDSDKILVMDCGRAVEFGHPHDLLQDVHGYLAAMVKETGEKMEDELRKIAEDCYDQITSKKNCRKTS